MEDEIKKCCEYIKFIYSPLCFHPEELEVTYEKEENKVVFKLDGNKKDDGILIGRGGGTAQSVRLLVHAYSKANLEGVECLVKIKDHAGSNFDPALAKKSFSRQYRNKTSFRYDESFSDK